MKTEISRADILDLASYEKVRAEKRDAARMAKADRRAEVGPFATLSFENYDTIWLQIQEMLRIEKGGDGQLADELAAYNPLIPKGRDLAATLITLSFAGDTVTATPDDDRPGNPLCIFSIFGFPTNNPPRLKSRWGSATPVIATRRFLAGPQKTRRQARWDLASGGR